MNLLCSCTTSPGGPSDQLLPARAYLLVGTVAAGAVAQGGYHASGRILVGLGCLLALASASVTRSPGLRGLGWPALAGCALGAWTILRGLIAGAVPEALAAAATIGCLLAAMAVTGGLEEEEREGCAGLLGHIGVLVALGAWLGVAWRLPSLVVPVEHRVRRAGRLEWFDPDSRCEANYRRPRLPRGKSLISFPSSWMTTSFPRSPTAQTGTRLARTRRGSCWATSSVVWPFGELLVGLSTSGCIPVV
ncbi:MAG: hypothetical protein JXA67_16085 [Micromonosporaceae bacterium]|nr:hypothetical protein [Micromonosporaceae bacterium]